MREPLVILPGMMCDARLFAAQIETLSRDRAVMVAPVSGGERIEHIAEQIFEALPARFALLGYDFGATLAMELLPRLATRVTRLALMSTTPLSETPAMAAERDPLIARVRAGHLDDVIRAMVPLDALAPGPNRVATQEVLVAMARDLGPEVFVGQNRALQRSRDQQGTLRRCKLPTQIICGAHDTLTPVKRHAFMAELMPHATLHVIEEAGHVPSLEAPDQMTALLQNWLAQDVPA